MSMWREDQEETYPELKKLMTIAETLVYFRNECKICVVADAGPNRTQSSSDTAPGGTMESCGIRIQEPHSSRAEILPDRERVIGTRVDLRKVLLICIWA